MSFQPVTPLSGIVGLRFLERTQVAQQSAFDRDTVSKREAEYFRSNIASVQSAADLVKDRQLLKVALGAFGLDEDIGKKAFLRKILEEGSEQPEALANKFVDPRYRKFAEAFGFGNLLGPRNADPGFATQIIEAHQTRQFEIAVGKNDNDLRLALAFKREISTYAGAGNAASSGWFQVMGNPPLRRVFEAAYSLPASFGQLDIDRQRDILQQKTQALFGTNSLATFQDDKNVSRVVDKFLARTQADRGPGPNTPGYGALSLLSNPIGPISGARLNLILSNS